MAELPDELNEQQNIPWNAWIILLGIGMSVYDLIALYTNVHDILEQGRYLYGLGIWTRYKHNNNNKNQHIWFIMGKYTNNHIFIMKQCCSY